MISTRNIIAVMIFAASFAFTCLHLNISFALVAMVEPTKDEDGKIIEPECSARNQAFNTSLIQEVHFTTAPDYGPRYKWNSRIKALILGADDWGKMVMFMPGGFLGEKFGPHRVLTVAFCIGVILAFLTPVVASWNYVALVVLRFFQGLCGAFKHMFTSLKAGW